MKRIVHRPTKAVEAEWDVVARALRDKGMGREAQSITSEVSSKFNADKDSGTKELWWDEYYFWGIAKMRALLTDHHPIYRSPPDVCR